MKFEQTQTGKKAQLLNRIRWRKQLRISNSLFVDLNLFTVIMGQLQF